MLDKTFRMFEDTMKMFENEMNNIFRNIPKGSKKIKIKKGSIVTINGAKATLLNDVIVTTNDPNTLMGKK
jgi:hypothetical protein